jgi:hypothetical protein
VGTLDVAQHVSGNSYARTTPGAPLCLGANPQRAMASRAPYAAEHQQRHDDGERERGVERPPWNPCHALQDERRENSSKEQGHNYASDNSVPLIKVFAHRFHGARFYSLRCAAQYSRQITALHWLVDAYAACRAIGDSHPVLAGCWEWRRYFRNRPTGAARERLLRRGLHYVYYGQRESPVP